MPIASTSPNMLVMLMENPRSGEQREGSQDGDRHGQQRNQRRAPALQEQEHHEHHQADRR